uniref:Exonuclease 3'-5' domain-containing protein 2 n=1 Tax=Ciona savignyi TaxID=51511 RepID=H2YDP4_CIOSA
CLIAGVAATGAAVLLYLKTSNNQELTKRKGLGLDHYWPYNVVSKHTNSSVKAHVVSQCQDFENVLDLFLQELQHVKVIGFDCEWTSLSGKPLPVALLQLSTVSGFCLLIRLCCYTGNLPRQLLDVLSDVRIIKVGVGPLEDAKKLLHDYGIVVSGCLDLRSLDMRNRQTKDHIGLKGLALLYLDVSMNKSKHIQCSNWQSKTLSNEQIHYAANDAFIAARLFSVMSHCKLEDDLQLQAVLKDAVTDTVWSIVTSYCQGLVDCKFKQKNKNQ